MHGRAGWILTQAPSSLVPRTLTHSALHCTTGVCSKESKPHLSPSFVLPQGSILLLVTHEQIQERRSCGDSVIQRLPSTPIPTQGLAVSGEESMTEGKASSPMELSRDTRCFVLIERSVVSSIQSRPLILESPCCSA